MAKWAWRIRVLPILGVLQCRSDNGPRKFFVSLIFSDENYFFSSTFGITYNNFRNSDNVWLIIVKSFLVDHRKSPILDYLPAQRRKTAILAVKGSLQVQRVVYKTRDRHHAEILAAGLGFQKSGLENCRAGPLLKSKFFIIPIQKLGLTTFLFNTSVAIRSKIRRIYFLLGLNCHRYDRD